jgi:hypothetical protein
LTCHWVAAASNASNENPTLPLSSDSSFDFQILASLGEAIYSGADIAPLLGTAKTIKPGDMEDFSNQFYALAIHTKTQAHEDNDDPINARDTWFSTATYFRTADFYLHGNWSNPRINSLWDEQTAAFIKELLRYQSQGKESASQQPMATSPWKPSGTLHLKMNTPSDPL